MPRELDDYATLRERLDDVRRHIGPICDELATAALHAPNSYQGQPLLAAALLDLRDVQQRLEIAFRRTPRDEQEAKQP
jgi:hypothetical protein